MKNIDIRQALKEKNIKDWQFADALNIAEFTLCRRLRYELSEEQKEKILYVHGVSCRKSAGGSVRQTSGNGSGYTDQRAG